MSDNEDNLKIKINLDGLFSKTDDKPDVQRTTQQGTSQNVSPGPVPELSPTKNQEGLELKIKPTETKSSESDGKRISVQEVKLKVKSVADSESKKDSHNVVAPSLSDREKHISDVIKLHLKPKTASSSAFNALTSEEETMRNVLLKENVSSVDDVSDKTVKFAKKDIKYLYLAGAFVVVIILLYSLISSIAVLMTQC